MLPFCGQEKCSIDANGRLKLSPRFVNDFYERGSDEVVLHCLPEGALAIYPEDIYVEMRSGESRVAEKAGMSIVQRRMLRSFGALSHSDKISRQGRLTLPQAYRDKFGLQPGTEVYLVGVEIGVEIWNAERWKRELEEIDAHLLKKGEMEMESDLSGEF